MFSKYSESATKMDDLLCLIMSQDFTAAILDLSSEFPFSWLPVHLLDILYHAHVIELPDRIPSSSPNNIESQRNTPAALREFFVLEYGNSLLGYREQSFWRVAIGYFKTCPKQVSM